MTADKPVLTAGEVDVLRLAATGHKYRDIASLLHVSENVVKNRVRDASDALGTKNVTHTVAVALRRGLLEENPPMYTQEQLARATELVVQCQFGSAAMLQRKLPATFAESHRILDRLETLGVVGPADGARARDVLIEPGQLDDILVEVRKVTA